MCGNSEFGVVLLMLLSGSQMIVKVTFHVRPVCYTWHEQPLYQVYTFWAFYFWNKCRHKTIG